jgi:hypothetical protein
MTELKTLKRCGTIFLGAPLCDRYQLYEEELLEVVSEPIQIERAVITMRGIRRQDDMPNWKCLNQECPGEHPVVRTLYPPLIRKSTKKFSTNIMNFEDGPQKEFPPESGLRSLV